MARITVEDCRKIVRNRFELVILAAHRARELSIGAPPMVDAKGDKDAIKALREIAQEAISVEDLREAIIKRRQQPADSSHLNKEIRGSANRLAEQDIASLLQAELEENEGYDISAAVEDYADDKDDVDNEPISVVVGKKNSSIVNTADFGMLYEDVDTKNADN